MAAITWAQTVRCDYPDCMSVAEVTMDEKQMMRVLPPGWLDLASRAMTLRNPFGQDMRELCSIHARFSIGQIAEVWALEEKRTDG